MDSSKPGLFYSPPKSNYQPPGGGGGGGRGRANTSGSDSSTTDLIIPEESSDMCIQKQSEGKYSCSRDDRHRVRHKHRRHEWQCKHGSFSSMFVCLFFHMGLFGSVQKLCLLVNYVIWFMTMERVSFNFLSIFCADRKYTWIQERPLSSYETEPFLDGRNSKGVLYWFLFWQIKSGVTYGLVLVVNNL